MENIVAEVRAGLLFLTIDLTQEVGESSSGKSMIIATTGGNVSVPGYEEIKLGLNVYRPVTVARAGRRSR